MSTGPTTVTLSAFGGGRPAPAHELAALHRELLPSSPALRLGRGFLERFYYGVLPDEGLVFGSLAYVGDTPVGFVVATTDANAFLATAVRRRSGTLLSVMLRHPPSPSGVLMGARIALDRQNKRQSEVGEILSFGVRSPDQGGPASSAVRRRVSRDLLRSALTGLGERPVVALVDESNTMARLMYGSLGWTVSGRVTSGWPVPQLIYQSPPQPTKASTGAAGTGEVEVA